MFRPWAFWRRLQYLTGLGLFLFVVIGLIFVTYFYTPPGCFDGKMNGGESGIDCGGACYRICSVDVLTPTEQWTRAFEVVPGQYNAVAYIENRNLTAGMPAMNYTFGLYDQDGLIVEKMGTTVLPPDSVYPIFEGRILTGDRIPTHTTIDLETEGAWYPAELGRELFEVVERGLSNSDVSPRLDVTLRNTSIDDARDVDIVTTIFDRSGKALTSSRTVVPYFAGRTTQDVVFTWPQPIAKTVRSCEVPTDVVVAIDLSGSMNNDNDNPPEPVTSVLRAANAFVGRLKQNDQVAIVTFATDANNNLPLTRNTANARSIVSGLTIDPEEETGSTNTGSAFTVAAQIFSSSLHNPDARKVMVLLTDGLATAPDPDPEGFAIEEARKVDALGVDTYVIGLGQAVNMDFVRTIATGEDKAYQALTTEEVDAIYQSITAAICEDGAAVIDVVPKSSASFDTGVR